MTGLRALTVAALLTLQACANTAGIAEFRIYTQAIDSLGAASQPIADRMRIAERANARIRIDAGEEVRGVTAGTPIVGLAPRFMVEHAPYLADSGDPPFAGAMRASMASLQRFNAALLVYAEGRGLDEARADIEAITGDLAAGFGALGAAVPAAAPVVGAFLEGAAFLGGIGSREAFRDILRAEGERVDALLEALHRNAPVAFEVLTLADRTAREDALLDFEDARAEELRLRIVNERKLVAEWVLMVELARRALAEARAAIDAPGTAGSGIANAAVLAADLRVRLERIRELTAAIR